MKKRLTDDLEIREYILEGLKNNKGYCPCVLNSINKPEYKCPCEDFRNNTLVGETCYCGLYVKEEN